MSGRRNNERLVPTYTGYIATSIDALLIIQNVLENRLPLIKRRPKDKEKMSLIKSGNIFVFVEESSGIKRWTDGVSWSPSRILGRFLIYRELDKDALPTRPNESLSGFQFDANHDSSSTSSNTGSTDLDIRADYSKESPSTGKRRKALGNIIDDGGSSTYLQNLSNDDSRLEAERSIMGSLVGSYVYKENGLMKKSLSLSLVYDDQTPTGNQKSKKTLHLVSYYSANDVLNNVLPQPSKDLFFKETKLSFDILDALRRSTIGSSVPIGGRKNDAFQQFNGFSELDGVDEETEAEFQAMFLSKLQNSYPPTSSTVSGMYYSTQMANQQIQPSNDRMSTSITHKNIQQPQQQLPPQPFSIDFAPPPTNSQFIINHSALLNNSGQNTSNHLLQQQPEIQQNFVAPQSYPAFVSPHMAAQLGPSATTYGYNRRHSSSGNASGAPPAGAPAVPLSQTIYHQHISRTPTANPISSSDSSAAHSPLSKQSSHQYPSNSVISTSSIPSNRSSYDLQTSVKKEAEKPQTVSSNFSYSPRPPTTGSTLSMTNTYVNMSNQNFSHPANPYAPHQVQQQQQQQQQHQHQLQYQHQQQEQQPQHQLHQQQQLHLQQQEQPIQHHRYMPQYYGTNTVASSTGNFIVSSLDNTSAHSLYPGYHYSSSQISQTNPTQVNGPSMLGPNAQKHLRYPPQNYLQAQSQESVQIQNLHSPIGLTSSNSLIYGQDANTGYLTDAGVLVVGSSSSATSAPNSATVSTATGTDLQSPRGV
ncbi:hypothetical protein CANARDRAFT_6486 [[Candida] arabinofermentans NRRL YB-2248]|uniref:Uncharacterized protein n=1 Tax=[Candida] arabinofermentans NRRL YB-2248 TaxID=983967 RepID=A0A1E4T596_9ASCO|nr:hypothetical protein CANARDRAFT_6486 [[Candida] arabinofermentans NRRL YB-2248]